MPSTSVIAKQGLRPRQGINEQTSTENSGTPGELSSFNSLRRSTANGSSQTSATVNRSGTHITRKATQTSPATTQNHASVLTTQASPSTPAAPSRVTVVQFQTSTITVKPLNNALITEKPTTPVVQSPADGSPSTMSQSEGNVSPTIINSVSRPSGFISDRGAIAGVTVTVGIIVLTIASVLVILCKRRRLTRAHPFHILPSNSRNVKRPDSISSSTHSEVSSNMAEIGSLGQSPETRDGGNGSELASSSGASPKAQPPIKRHLEPSPPSSIIAGLPDNLLTLSIESIRNLSADMPPPYTR